MKSAPWIVGSAAVAIYFAVFEALAFIYPDRFYTLSHFIAQIGANWPFAIFLMGGLAIGLGVHFFWPWRDNPLGKGGG